MLCLYITYSGIEFETVLVVKILLIFIAFALSTPVHAIQNFNQMIVLPHLNHQHSQVLHYISKMLTDILHWHTYIHLMSKQGRLNNYKGEV